MSLKKLFTETKVGNVQLKNRIVMAPMTRNRAGAGNVPGELIATYYRQRAGAGLIVTEATQVMPEGVGYPNTPGIHSREQVEGWKKVTKGVHDAGGKIFLQLWHVGRISHPLYQPNGQLPVSASAVKPAGQIYTPQGMKPYETPRELRVDEIPGIVAAYRKAAQNAKEAGFDGVEIHGANGYLIDQFLRTGTNHRTDAYGGSAQNRVRFMVEVAKAVIEGWGDSKHVAIRLSPSNTFNDMSDANPVETFSLALRELDKLNLAYVHLVEATAADKRHGGTVVETSVLRPNFHGPLIVNAGYTGERAEAVISAGQAELVAFGVPFISNPDLPHRLRTGAKLAPADSSTFYGGTEKGYTDYPALEASAV